MYNQHDARQFMGFSDFDRIILMKTFMSQIMLKLYILPLMQSMKKYLSSQGDQRKQTRPKFDNGNYLNLSTNHIFYFHKIIITLHTLEFSLVQCLQ